MKKSSYGSIPKRIFLDSNILQYLQDFGEFIFDHYQETDEYLVSAKGNKILKDSKLYNEIRVLKVLLLGLDRTNIEFAISQNTFAEVQRKQDDSYMRWFFEMWDYWQNIIQAHKENVSSGPAKLKKFDNDRSLLGRLSKDDSKIIRDAISLNCNAVLTVDRFRNLHKEINDKYKMMVLYPTDLWGLLKPFQALWH